MTGGAIGAGRFTVDRAAGAGRLARDTTAATGFKVTPVRRITATAFPPAVPLLSPSISWPLTSCRPEGDVPLIVSWSGFAEGERLPGE